MIGASALLALALQASASEEASCTRRTARRATVVQIARQPERFLDRCVTVTGAFAGITLYSGREGMYLVGRYGRDGNRVAANQVHRIGIDNQQMRNLRMRYPQETTVTGRVDSCERRSQRIIAAGGIPFLGGYCHYHDGPSIVVSAYSITERQYDRLMGEDARQRFGNLAPMSVDGGSRDVIEAAAAAFHQALRARDRARLMQMHDIRTENPQERTLLYSLLESQYSVFRQVRERDSVQTAFFVTADENGAPFDEQRPLAAATICYCRTNDCAGRWPIALNDANNEENRPYACTQFQVQQGDRQVFSTSTDGGWMREPASTAIRP